MEIAVPTAVGYCDEFVLIVVSPQATKKKIDMKVNNKVKIRINETPKKRILYNLLY
jgi:hypothetical protein